MKVVWLVRTKARGRTWRQYHHRYAVTWSNGVVGGVGSTTDNPTTYKTRAEAEDTARQFNSQFGPHEEAKVVARRVDEGRAAEPAFAINVTYSEADARVTLESFRAIRDIMRRSR